MINGDYFFLFFLGTISITRVILLSKRGSPSIKGFRLRHYMYGVALIVISFLNKNFIAYAIGFGLFIDELPLVIIKGPGHKKEYWRGLEDYFSPWCVASVFILVFLTYIVRSSIILPFLF